VATTGASAAILWHALRYQSNLAADFAFAQFGENTAYNYFPSVDRTAAHMACRSGPHLL
jgi:hypothetical protein